MFFLTALSCYGGYHLKRGWKPLHDVVGINCKKGSTTENQSAGVKYMGKGCMSMIVCVLSNMTSLPLLGRGRKSWYIIIVIYGNMFENMLHFCICEFSMYYIIEENKEIIIF